MNNKEKNNNLPEASFKFEELEKIMKEYIDQLKKEGKQNIISILNMNPIRLDENNNVIIDFNKSLNPPCVFSIFTTCPVPRKENKLSIKINAGEKNYNGVLFSSVYQ